jgi:hypothetical protein
MHTETETPGTPESIEHEAMLALVQVKHLRNRLRELADLRPPITLAWVCKDQCNFTDRTVEGEVRAFQRRYDAVDVSNLEDAEGHHDIDEWDYVAGGRTPYEVRKYTQQVREDTQPLPTYLDETGTELYGYLEDHYSDDGEPWPDAFYTVVDTDSGEQEGEYTEDEDEAREECERLNRDHVMENLYGFPFAHNYGVEIESYEIEDFAEAGFVVWRYKEDTLIAGIDGGGYSFLGEHWLPLFWRKAVRGGWIIETDTGPRRVA